MELSVVQLIRQAIRTADLSSAAAGGQVGSAVIEPRRHLQPEPQIEPRQHFHPTPVYERRPVIHPQPRVEQLALASPPEIPTPHITRPENPIQPPWKVLPWENPSQSRQTIKIVVHRTDVTHKGMMLDLFV